MLAKAQKQEAADRVQAVTARLANMSFVLANRDAIERMCVLGVGFPEEDSETGFEFGRRIESGILQFWPIYGDVDGEAEWIGGLTTCKGSYDWLFDHVPFIVYSFFCEKPVEMQAWLNAWEPIEKYGKRVGCNGVVLYSHIPRVQEIAINLGFAKAQTQFWKGF